MEKNQGGWRDLALPQEEGKLPKLHELGITYNQSSLGRTAPVVSANTIEWLDRTAEDFSQGTPACRALDFTGPLSARSFLALSRETAPQSEEERTAMVEAAD